MRTIIGIGRDHSASMEAVAEAAKTDFNNLIDSIRAQSGIGQNIGIFIEEFGNGQSPGYRCSTKNAPPGQVNHLQSYDSVGMTPLFDAVMQLLHEMNSVPNADDSETAFLVMVLTDGQNNQGMYNARDVARKIKELQATDRWTITFRTPIGGKRTLTQLGIPEDNILEWEAGDAIELERSAVATASAVSGYLAQRTQGVTASRTFYHTPDTSRLTTANVTASMTDVTDKIKEFFLVQAAEDGMKIQDFCLLKNGRFRLGEGFYELVKKERLQDEKMILVQFGHKYYAGTGSQARQLLGLPLTGEIRIQPSADKNRVIFVQSKAPNRKLLAGQRVVILPNP